MAPREVSTFQELNKELNKHILEQLYTLITLCSLHPHRHLHLCEKNDIVHAGTI